MLFDIEYEYRIKEGGVAQIDADSLEDAEVDGMLYVKEMFDGAYDIEVKAIPVDGN